MLHSKGNGLYFYIYFTTCGGGGAYGRVSSSAMPIGPKGLPQGPAVAGGPDTARRLGCVLLRWPTGGYTPPGGAGLAACGCGGRPGVLNTTRWRWPGRVCLRWPAGGLNTARWLSLGRLCRTRRHSTGPFVAQHGGLQGHTEGLRFCLLVHGRVYGQEVLGFRRLWARALVSGLNQFCSVLETACAVYGAPQWIGGA